MFDQKIIIAAFSLIAFNPLIAQLGSGPVPADIRDMAALNTVHTFMDLYGTYDQMVPAGYEHIYSSKPTKLDNKFEIFQKGDVAAIVIRGSTGAPLSWMTNVYASMIPAEGQIALEGKKYKYKFASDTAAAVHAGYTLAITTISNDVLGQLKKLYKSGVRNIIITGHSQGGALAHLLSAYLHNLGSSKILASFRFKTYAFASPMVGNQAFNDEYEKAFCTTLGSYNIYNPEDFVTKMPISYDEQQPSVGSFLSSLLQNRLDVKGAAFNTLINLFGRQLLSISDFNGSSIQKQFEDALGDLEMPDFREELNYSPNCERIELEPFDYPLILLDPMILENDSIMAVEERDENGVFLNKDLYQQEPTTFQHKPYNYYVAVLKKYFPAQYQALDPKILPENM